MAILKNFMKGKATALPSISTDPAVETNLLAAIVESSDDAIIGKSLDGIIMSWNKGAERQYGYTAGEAVGKPVSMLIPQNRADDLPKFLDMIKRGEPVAHYETQRLRKDGKIIDVSVSLSPIRDAAGQVIGAAAIARNLIERKESARYTRSLIEASPDPLVTISPEGKITDVNEATVSVTGVSRDELIGTDFSIYFTEPEKALEGYTRVFKEGAVTDYPLTIHHKAGRLIDVLYNASVYKDENGNVLGVFAAARDVTASKQALFYARSVIEAGLDPMITISPEGKITDVNEATIKATGTSREKLIGSDFANYFSDPEEARQGYQQVFRDGFVREYPLSMNHASGVVTDVLYNASVYKDDKGNVYGAIAAVRDITAQKKVEEKFHETSAYARSLIEASLDPLFIISPEGKITGVNHATEDVTGVTREWLVDSDFSTYFTEPHKAQAGYRQVLKEGEVRDYPLSIRNPSGTSTDVSFNASVYKDALGTVRGIFAVARDVTETKKVSRYARSLIEASLDPLVTISPDGKVTDVNEATIQVTGVPREKLIGTDFLAYFTEPQKAREGYEQVFKKGFVTDYPLTIRSQAGELTDVLYNASVYKDEKGNVLGVFAAARDNTRVKEAAELKGAIVKAKEDFMLQTVHDLRAPANIIRLLLEEYGDVKELAAHPEKITEENKLLAEVNDRMRKLIEDILANAKGTSTGGVAFVKKENVDCTSILRNVLHEFEPLIKKKGLSATYTPDAQVPMVSADAEKVREVFSNLLDNALKYTSQGSITITHQVLGQLLKTDIHDTGVGIAKADIKKLFTPYFRAGEKQVTQGTGLGLYFVKNVIVKMGGAIEVTSQLGVGTTFTVFLPIADKTLSPAPKKSAAKTKKG